MAKRTQYRPRAFISYYSRGTDGKVAKALRAALVQHRVRVDAWRDREDLEPGSTFILEIQTAIAVCDFFVLLLSRRSVASAWCRRERARAIALGKSVIVLYVDEVDAVDWPLELQADLFQLGTRGDIIKRLHQVAPADPSRYRFVEPADLGAPIEGLVRAKALHDELTGELFAAIETPRGEVHYVRLPKDAAEFVGEGDIVRVVRTTESWVKSTDQVLGRIAALNGGIYDPETRAYQRAHAGPD